MKVDFSASLQKDFIVLFYFLPFFSFLASQEPKEFNKLNELLEYVNKKNSTLNNLELDKKITKINKNASNVNIFNFRVPVISQFNYNPINQVGFFPAIFFGGKVGEFVETPTSPQYNFTFSIQPQLEIVNFVAISQSKLAKINEKLVESKSNLTKQNIYEEINNCYFNILLLKEQKIIFTQILQNANKIKEIVSNKYKEGFVRKTDLNEAENTVISIENNINQVEIELEKQQLFLNLFVENEIKPLLNEQLISYENESYFLEVNNNLPIENMKLQYRFSETEHKLSKSLTLPVISFFSNLSLQNASNSYFFNADANWITNQTIGLRLSWDLPLNFNTLTNISTKKIQAAILKTKLDHLEKENNVVKKQIILDFKKYIETAKNDKKIYLLKKENFEKTQNQYLENLTSLDKLLFSLSESMNSKLNLVNTLSKVGLFKNKIQLLNKINSLL
ncbi:MAG: TolC family protein [Solirubrobacteraceae bacterium]